MNKILTRKFAWAAAAVLLLFQAGAQELKPVKYVFLFIGDGMSYPQREAADRYLKTLGRSPLLINSMPYNRSTRTVAANNVVTDSAASGTAIATGSKTNKGYLGIAPDKSPLYSCAVTARKNGRKVGILTTVTLNNATPAAFYGHQDNRHNYYQLGIELVKSNFDYFAGGTIADAMPRKNARPENIPALKQRVTDLEAEIQRFQTNNDRINRLRSEAQKAGDKAKVTAFTKEKQENSRKWAKVHTELRLAQRDLKCAEDFVGNIVSHAAKQGYLTVTSSSPKDRIAALKPGKQEKVLVFGKLQNGGTIPWAIDAAVDPEATSLAFLTAKGIELLDNPDGFFMMVEGGKIDWGCHGNDLGTMIHEMIAFDEAVKVAADFAKKHPDDTLIVVTGDHETGGLEFCGKSDFSILNAQKHSSEYFSTRLRRLKSSSETDKITKSKQLVTDVFGLQFSGSGPMAMSGDEKNALEGALYRALGEKSSVEAGFYSTAEAAIKAGKNPGAVAIANLLVSRRAGVKWNTQGHSALPVRTSAMGAQAEQFLRPGTLTAEQKKMHHTHNPNVTIPAPEIDNTDIGLRMKQVVAPVR